MARKFLTSVDLALNSLQNAMLHPVSSDPTGLTTAQKGLVWFNTTTNRLKVWDGAAAVDLLDLGSATGTITAAKVSDLASTVQAYRLDQFAAATSPITVPNGTAAGHAVNKSQLDAVQAAASTGISIKEPVRAATTANITLSAAQTIDGVSVVAGDRVLVKNQTTGSENGIYVAAAGAWSRAADMDATGEVVPGTVVFVREGTTNGDKQFAVTSDATITVGTTTMTWGQITGTGTSYSGGAGLTLSGSTFDVGAGTGISVAADSVAVDTTVVARKVTGTIPATTSGIFSVSGAAVTVNHGLNNLAPRVTVRYGSTPVNGTTGALVEVEEIASDANNVVLTFPAAPTANQYVISVVA